MKFSLWLFLKIATLLFSLSQAIKLPEDIKLYHVNNPSSHLSFEQNVVQMQSRDQARLEYLSSLVARKSDSGIASARQILQSSSYVVRAEFGTPGQPLLMALDNSYDSAWIPCSGCIGCSSAVFDPAMSTSFGNLPCGVPQCNQVINPSCFANTCGFNFTYGSSTIEAHLSNDILKLAQDPIPGFTFGCVQSSNGSSAPPQGLLSLGRGPLSFLAQTSNLYNSTFSYCLPSLRSNNFTGLLRLGPVGQPKSMKTTPLLKNPRRQSLYYVNMIGIKVGSKILDIPERAFAFDSSTGGGTIFDSAITFSSIVKPAYIALRDEFRRRMGNATVTSIGGFDTCYTVPIRIPSITFLFDGMSVTLPPDNFLIRSSAGNAACLAMAAAPDNFDSVLNIIGNFQQQNHRIVFDLPNSRVGVARQFCS